MRLIFFAIAICFLSCEAFAQGTTARGLTGASVTNGTVKINFPSIAGDLKVDPGCTVGQLLRYTGTGNPGCTTLTFPATATAGGMFYMSGTAVTSSGSLTPSRAIGVDASGVVISIPLKKCIFTVQGSSINNQRNTIGASSCVSSTSNAGSGGGWGQTVTFTTNFFATFRVCKGACIKNAGSAASFQIQTDTLNAPVFQCYNGSDAAMDPGILQAECEGE